MASTTRLGMLCARQFQASSRRVLLQPQSLRQSSTTLSQRIAPFSTTTQRKILPPGPQVVRGGVNEAAPVPPPQYVIIPRNNGTAVLSAMNTTSQLFSERAISVALIPLTLAPFAAGSLNPTTDALLVAGILVHSHMGFQQIITDYIPQWRMPGYRKLFDYALLLATLLVGIGFYEFETNDVGLTEAIKRIWHAGANDATVGKSDLNALGHDGKLKNLKE